MSARTQVAHNDAPLGAGFTVAATVSMSARYRAVWTRRNRTTGNSGRSHSAVVHDDAVLRLGHLNITVADLDRSVAFYSHWFGFDRVLADYDDRTRFITDSHGFELGLHPAVPTGSDTDWHFGFLSTDAAAVRDLMASLSAAGVPISDREDEASYVGLKCQDPDGYLIEVYWEPRT